MTDAYNYEQTFLDRTELFEGVLARRVVAFIMDIAVVAIVSFFAAGAILLLGLLTFGLGWLLFVIFMPLVLGAYLAFTLGGPAAATPGMAMMGIQMRLYDGGKLGPLGAIAHGILYYLSVTLLTPFILLLSLFTQHNRLLHDWVLGTYVVRSEYL